MSAARCAAPGEPTATLAFELPFAGLGSSAPDTIRTYDRATSQATRARFRGAPRRGHRRAAFGTRSRLQPARRDARRTGRRAVLGRDGRCPRRALRVGASRAGQHRLHVDAPRPELDLHALAQEQHERFGGAVHGHAELGRERDHRRKVDDRAALSREKAWGDRARQPAPGSTAAERRRAVIGSCSAMVGALMLSRLSEDPELSAELLQETRAFLNAQQPSRSRKACG